MKQNVLFALRESNMETNIRRFLEAVEKKNLPVAKSLIKGVNEELEYLSKIIGTHSTGVHCISNITKLVKNVDLGLINIAWGKVNPPLHAAYSGHLEYHLQQRLVLSRTPQDRTVLSGPGQTNSHRTDDRSDEIIQHFNGSGKLKSSSTEKYFNHPNVKREQYIDNIEVKHLQQHTHAERGDRNYEPSKLDKSKLASQMVRHNNPDITDLSDINRPTKLAERFSELYDNEWTEAFEAMSKGKKQGGHEGERQIIECLLKIVEEAYIFCSKETTSLKKSLRERQDELDEINKSIKEHAEKEIYRLQQAFCQKEMQKIEQIKQLPPIQQVDAYARRAVELTWWMNIQDPPVHMVLSEQPNHKFDANLYRAYTKSGSEAAFLVWPPLTLYKGGGVLCKGVMQCE